MTKAIMMIKQSNASEVIDELKDVISKEPVLIKIVSDSSFDLAFNKTEDVTVDLPDNQLLALAMQAHNKDITLNEHLNNILREAIERKNKVAFTKGITPNAETSLEINEEVDGFIEKKKELEEKLEQRLYQKHSELMKELNEKKKQLVENQEINEAVDGLIKD